MADNYENSKLGWLTPAGRFIPADFGQHEDIAFDIVDENDWENEWSDWKKEQNKSRLCGDFLVEKKGYVLLDNPAQDDEPATPTYHCRLTKKQREFLYDYYMKEDSPNTANMFMCCDE